MVIIVLLSMIMFTQDVGANMRISQEGIELIKKYEGLSITSYKDIVGVWTIGYGHTRTAEPNQVISQFEAEDLLRDDVDSAERCVINLLDETPTQAQYDALVSFVFNLGCKSFQSSTLRRKINLKDKDAVKEFSRWVYAGGKSVRGLQRRRAAEAELFTSQ